MKLRIVKGPTGQLDGMVLKRYVPGEVYDLSPSMAYYLVVEGFAKPEMRTFRRTTVKKQQDRRA